MAWRNCFTPRAFPRATVTHSTSARRCQNSAPLCTPPSLISPGAAAPNVLPAIALHQPRLSLDLRLPEWPCAKYSINYDIRRLVMTLSFFSGHLYVFSIWRQAQTGFPLAPLSASTPKLLPSCSAARCGKLLCYFMRLLVLCWQRAII